MFQFPFFLLLAGIQALYIIKKTKAKMVVGTGGFGSFPCVFIAVLLGKPTLITEIDSIPGLTTRVLARFVKEIRVVFPSAKQRLPQRKVKICNFPIREAICHSPNSQFFRAKGVAQFKENTPTILVFGGSRGALAINKIIAEIVGLSAKGGSASGGDGDFPLHGEGRGEPLLPDFQFIWLTGSNFVGARHAVPLHNVFVCDFLKDMGRAYKHSQLAITRAGALTIGELIATRTPAILMPYPYAAKQHQLLNAKFLEKTGGAKVILEKNLTPSILVKEIKNLFKNNGEELQKMKKALENLARENGAKQIAKRIEELLGG